MVNNADWLRSMGLLEFLRDTGKHFTVNYMMAKESVKRRLGGDEGISFTEFSYLLLQAYDYLVAARSHRLHAADGRQRSVGQHRRRQRLDPEGARREGARPGDAAGDDLVGYEVRQDRSRNGVARSRADVAVPLLPVLAEHRRSGCR